MFAQSKDKSVTIAIVGNPADGKTELAKQYCASYREQYHHVWFVPVEEWEATYRNLALTWGLFTKQGLFSDQEENKINIDLVIQAVHEEFNKTRWIGKNKSLIVFDNATSDFLIQKLKGSLPSHTDILITSRGSDWPIQIRLSEESNQLTLQEGTEILRQWIKNRFEEEEAHRIVKRFEHLPVVIAQAGHYIAMAETMQMKDFLALFETKRKEILTIKTASQNTDIVTSLELHLALLEQHAPEALKLFLHCLHLPGKNIPISLLCKLLAIDPHQLNVHLSRLGTLVVCDREAITIHDLFQEILEQKYPLQKDDLDKFAEIISPDFEDFLETDPSKALPIYKHAFEKAKQIPNNAGIVGWSFKLGKLYRMTGSYSQARAYFQESLTLCQKVHGEEHFFTTKIYDGLAASYRDLGQFPEALKHLQKALEIRRKWLGEDHLDTAVSYNNVGIVFGELGQYSESLGYLQKALKIYQQRLGEDHPRTALSYSNMGVISKDLGLHTQALEYSQKALEIRQRQLGGEHLDTALSYNNVAMSLRHLEQYKEALQYQQKALEIYQKKLGEEHPITATYYENLGSIFGDLGQHQKALQYKQKALEIHQKWLGDEHPKTAASYNSVGGSLRDLGQYQDAQIYLQKALEIRRKRLGENHLDTASSYNNVGMNFRDLRQHQEALQYKQKALEIYQKKFGEDHLRTATSYNNIGVYLSDLEQYQKALTYLQKALEIRRKRLGENHSDTAASFNNVAFCIGNLGEYPKALEYSQKALKIYQEKLGENHSETAASYNNVGAWLRALGKHSEAVDHVKKAFVISCKIFQTKHPSQEMLLKNLINTLDSLSDTSSCEEVKKEVLPLAIEKFGKDDPLVCTLKNLSQ